MGAVIAWLAACAPPPAGGPGAQVGAVSIGWDANGAVFSASFWDPVAPPALTATLAGGCLRLSGEAEAERAPLSAGRLRIAGDGLDVASRPIPAYETVFYPPPDLAGAPWGHPVLVQADGADLPGFAGLLDLPAPVFGVAFGPDPAVRWTPDGRGTVELSIEADSQPGDRWWCATADTGQWRIPSAIVDGVSAPDRLRVQWRVVRETQVDLDGRRAALLGWAGATGTIDLP
jgi:hypothetical protein